MFSFEFCEIFKNTYFYRIPLVAASRHNAISWLCAVYVLVVIFTYIYRCTYFKAMPKFHVTILIFLDTKNLPHPCLSLIWLRENTSSNQDLHYKSWSDFNFSVLVCSSTYFLYLLFFLITVNVLKI